MPKMIQLRNVPDKLHRRLKEQAASLGLSLSDYLIREAERIAERPTPEEFLAKLRSLPPIDLDVSAADVIREAREEREREIFEAYEERRATERKKRRRRA